VFKPFVAAYALDQLAFDPSTTYACADIGGGRGGFELMHCNALHGHSDLQRALSVSCNSYFAQLGLQYTPESYLDMAHTFGFGQPTGIKNLAGPGRAGLREDAKLSPKSDAALIKDLENRHARLQFANGLGFVEATPMQVARATAAIATGRLPEIRLVHAIGEELVPRASSELGIKREALEFVRHAMRSVVTSGEGSAHGKGVDQASLGFTFACKTGSADYLPFRDVPDMPIEDRIDKEAGKLRKHTWITGWFPAEEPKAILVVYLHDMSESASRTAIYVAGQFLRTDAVKSFVARAAAVKAGEAGEAEKAEEPR
jgi:penicillin-binding protein 2